jgi:hypothetical protein
VPGFRPLTNHTRDRFAHTPGAFVGERGCLSGRDATARTGTYSPPAEAGPETVGVPADGFTPENRSRTLKSSGLRAVVMTRQQLVALALAGLMLLSSVAAVASIF